MKKEGFVYRWDNIKNGMYYIGSHKGDINDDYIGSGVYFTHAYNKSPNDFSRTILYVGSDYREYEDNLLKELNCSNDEKSYNLKNDAIGGWEHVHTPEKTKYRGLMISKAKKGKTYPWMFYDKSGSNNPMWGKSQKSESRKLQSKTKKEHWENGSYDKLKKPVKILPDNITFDSVADCARHFGLKQSTISIYLSRDRAPKSGVLKNKLVEYA